LLWRPPIFWMHAVSDSLIALSYYSIPLALIYFVRRRKDVVFPRVFYMFAAFILACGTTHIMGLWTLWNPDYALDGLVKVVTAGLSLATAIVLWPLMPQALAVPSPAQLAQANRVLRQEIAIREQAEMAVRRLNEELERRVAERAGELARREQIYRTVIETSLDGFILMDEHGRIAEWNSQAEQTFGWPADAAIGRQVVETIIPPAARGAHREGLKLFLETGQQRVLQQRIEMTALRRDGREFPVELMIVPMQIEGAWWFSAFVHDLTERQRAEDQLRQAQKMEAVGQLTGGLAHDFNNLLTVVVSNLDLIVSEPETSPKIRKLAELALGGALRGAELTRQLLAFARRQSLAARPIEVNEIVASTTELLRRTLGENIRIELHLAQDLWTAFADQAQVGTALANLAINARDAMPAGGTLSITTANKFLDERYAAENADVTPGEYVMLAVTDTGTGIPPELLQRVFEPFFTTKPEGKGSGLGLSMVYGFAKQSGGHVKIYSEVGHGTTFRLYLPRAQGEAVAPAETVAPERQEAPVGGSTILVVDDNADVRQVVMMQLAALRYEALAAKDAAAALAILESGQRIDLLFTDIVMPGMSGFELATEARRRRPGLKVLFTSGFAESAAQSEPGSGGLMLSKPYRLSELSQMIRTALAGVDA
ncbi:MAG TPA: PAS domain S-box protein, partial [Paracoccaceae bacterium]|nr:PAS domain S-box protein [Paracoccaceae bacterium]